MLDLNASRTYARVKIARRAIRPEQFFQCTVDALAFFFCQFYCLVHDVMRYREDLQAAGLDRARHYVLYACEPDTHALRFGQLRNGNRSALAAGRDVCPFRRFWHGRA